MTVPLLPASLSHASRAPTPRFCPDPQSVSVAEGVGVVERISVVRVGVLSVGAETIEVEGLAG